MIVFEPLHPAPRLPVGSGHALQPGDTLEDFEITQVLGLTSFGVIYLARDQRHHQVVALKEYLPVAVAARGAHNRVELRDPSHAEAFQRGLHSFIGEALALSQFKHPSLLQVSSVWEGNGTAYRAMPHYVGTSLLARRFSSKLPPTESQLRSMLDGLLGALELLHGAGLSHGQVEPMNILLQDDGCPVLLDFDATRHAILSDIHLPHVDAYSDPASLAVNQSADLRALAAVLHFAISGQWSPLTAGAPRRHESLVTTLSRMKDGVTAQDYSPELLEAIDTALAPDTEPHSAIDFRQLFDPVPAFDSLEHASTQPMGLLTQPLPLAVEMPAVATVTVVMPVPAVSGSAGSSSDLARNAVDTPAAVNSAPSAGLDELDVGPGAEAPSASHAHATAAIQPTLAAAVPTTHPSTEAIASAGAPRPKRPPPRPIPERTTHEYPLNSSESVLELLASFGRPQQQLGDIEPFQSPAVPTLTEEAEPALPPLKESPFDRLARDDEQRGAPAGASTAATSTKSRKEGQRHTLVLGLGLVFLVFAVTLAWMFKAR